MADIAFTIYIDSRENITMDVYAVFVEAGVGYKIDYVGSLHTDSTKDYFYAPDDPDDNVDFNSVITNTNQVIMYDGMSTETRDADAFYSAYLDPNKDSFGTAGSPSPLYCESGQSYGSVLARTDDTDYWYLPSDVAQKNGQTVDLSDIMVYAPLDKDCVVLVFDIQYAGGGTVTNHTAGDYAFRHLVQIEGMSKEDMQDLSELEGD